MAQSLYSRVQVSETVLSEKHIIVIDDYKEFREFLRRTLLGLGAKAVDITDDGNDAISRISHKAYDIILCDHNLGEEKKDGQQIYEELRLTNKIGYSTMFIMITAENNVNTIMSIMDYQPDGYIIKPFTNHDLIKRISALSGKKQLFYDIDRAINDRIYQHALKLCSELAVSHKQYLMDIFKIMGDLYMLTEQYGNAEKIYLKVISMYRLPWVVIGLGKTYFHTRRFMDARDMFKSLIRDNDMFIPAYDWLARTLEELGDKRGAQAVLEDAVRISPKAILRQRALGNIAFFNKDYNTAETSFRKAVKLGKTSLFKDSADYSQLAKVFVNKQSLQKALHIVEEMREDFTGNSEIILQATLLETDIYTEANKKDKALDSLREAEKLYNQLDGNVSPNIAIDIAKSFIKFGDKEKGMKLMEYVIKNNHANKDILNKIQSTFQGLGIGDEGVDFIANTRTEIIKINNRGVELIEQGKYLEAIGLFEKAADGLPSNITINLNAMRAMVGFMQKKGRDDKLLYKCEKYIKRIESTDPNNVKYLQLLDAYRTLMRRPDMEDF